MTAKEWLSVMGCASDFPDGGEKSIIKYGEMLLVEFIHWYAKKYEMKLTDEFKRKLINEFLKAPES